MIFLQLIGFNIIISINNNEVKDIVKGTMLFHNALCRRRVSLSTNMVLQYLSLKHIQSSLKLENGQDLEPHVLQEPHVWDQLLFLNVQWKNGQSSEY